MKITVTGSLSYISLPLIQRLKGHDISVVSSKAEKQAAIEALGASAAIGDVADVAFLTKAFSGADAVYCMMSPYGEPNAAGMMAKGKRMADSYYEAIKQSGVQRVVYLSSIAADMTQGNGLIVVHHHAEALLSQLDVDITFIRPAGFYKNLFHFAGMIKSQGKIMASYGGDDVVVWVDARDMADAIAEELVAKGRKIRYVASDELSCKEAAKILGAAIGQPDLKWETISDEQQLQGMIAHGMEASIAANFVTMNASIHSGVFYADYYRHQPLLGKVKMSEFAKEFAAVYHQI